MPLSCKKFAGPGYRFAKPLNGGQTPHQVLFSDEKYPIRSHPVGSDAKVSIELAFLDGGQEDLIARARLVGPEHGRVQVPIKTKAFQADAVEVVKFALASTQTFLSGAEPCSFYRKTSLFEFYFSRDPAQHFQNLLDQFIGPQGFHESFRTLFFYSETPDRPTRQVELPDAWFINLVAEMKLGSQVIDPAEIARRSGWGDTGIIARIGRINAQRQAWGLDSLSRHPSYPEIRTAVEKLRGELLAWPPLTAVAKKLGVEPSDLRSALDHYNQKRKARNEVPLYLA
jgi:hypothetical protein